MIKFINQIVFTYIMKTTTKTKTTKNKEEFDINLGQLEKTLFEMNSDKFKKEFISRIDKDFPSFKVYEMGIQALSLLQTRAKELGFQKYANNLDLLPPRKQYGYEEEIQEVIYKNENSQHNYN